MTLRSLVLMFAIAAPAAAGAQSAPIRSTAVVVAPGIARRVDTPLTDSLEALERASWIAWQHRDSAFFSRFLSPDHVEVGANGPISRAAVLAGVASPACVVTSFHVDRFTVTRLDERTAVVTYHAEQDTRCNGVAVPSPAWATSLYVWRDGRWQNALYQQTPVPRLTP